MKTIRTLRSVLALFALLAAFYLNAQTSCPGFKTYTQGGWSTTPQGNNPGTFLQNNFAAAFPAPNYLTIGCTNKIRLTSALAVRNFLPQTSTPNALPAGTLVNPTKNNYSNVFAGQVAALAITLRMDELFPNFGSSNTLLKNLVIAYGPFQGWTVQQLFEEANKKLGGCVAENFTFSQYNNAVDLVNKNYVNGAITGNYLLCPLQATCSTTPVTCFGGSDGTMTINVVGVSGPFTYNWQNGVAGSDSNVAVGLSTGSYSAVVSDQDGNTVTVTCTVGTNPEITVVPTVNHNLCHSTNGLPSGSISLNIQGGVGPYTVNWSDGGTGAVRSNLPAGEYCYTVSDNVNCEKTGCLMVNQPDPISLNVNVDQRVSCYNDCNAVLSATVNNGNVPYNSFWYKNNMIFSNSPSIGSLCSGTYYLIIEDDNFCTATSAPVTLDNPAPITLSSVLVVDQSDCASQVCDGSVTISITGGEAPYAIVWSNGQIGGLTVNNLCTGDQISVTITDNRNCTVTLDVALISCRIPCEGFRTQTQGGWGSPPNGNNPGQYLLDNFATAFPTGITLGCGSNTITFTTPAQIEAYLPSGGTAGALPTATVLSGQLLAAMISVGFDAAIPSFSPATTWLGDLTTNDSNFAGMTVSQIIAIANQVIGGCSTAYEFTQLNSVLSTINENYVDGTMNKGNLFCPQNSPGTAKSSRVELPVGFSADAYPNPVNTMLNVSMMSKENQTVRVALYNTSGQLIMSKNVNCTTGQTIETFDMSQLARQTYVLKIDSKNETMTKIIVVI